MEYLKITESYNGSVPHYGNQIYVSRHTRHIFELTLIFAVYLRQSRLNSVKMEAHVNIEQADSVMFFYMPL